MGRVYKRKDILAISCHFFIQLVHGHGCIVDVCSFYTFLKAAQEKIVGPTNSGVKVSNRKLIQLRNVQICVDILDMLIYFSKDMPGLPPFPPKKLYLFDFMWN